MTSQWIISRRGDLTWLIGPAAASFGILFMFYALTAGVGFDAAKVIPILYILWSLLFDGTHAFATYTRTYFDRDFARRSGTVLWYSGVFLVAGPLLILVYYWAAGVESTQGFFILFNRFGLCWAYYHLVRQHWGFVTLYRRKNGETDMAGRRLDGLLLGFGTMFPFFYYHAHYLQPVHAAETVALSSGVWHTVMINLWVVAALSAVGSYALFQFGPSAEQGAKRIGMFAVVVAVAGLGVACTALLGFEASLSILSQTMFAGLVITILLQAIYGVTSARKGTPVNRPKWLFMATVLAVHNAILLFPVPVLVTVVCLTIFHNVQYHRIVHFHNGNQYTGPEASVRFGFAATLAQRLIVYASLGLIYSLFTTVPRAAAVSLIQNPLLNFTITAFFWGIAFNHYYLDSLIWRPRKNSQLAQSLRVSERVSEMAATV